MSGKVVRFVSGLLPTVLGLSLALAVGPVIAAEPPPPQPNIIPAEVDVVPADQTVIMIPYNLTWWSVDIVGQGTSYELNFCPGDNNPCVNLGDFAPGMHSFSWAYDEGDYTQTWTITGVGGPAQATSHVKVIKSPH